MSDEDDLIGAGVILQPDFNSRGGPGLTMAETVVAYLDAYADKYDVDGIETDYRNAINERLDGTGIRLAGDEFIGTHPTPDNSDELINVAIGSVDLAEIIEKHAK